MSLYQPSIVSSYPCVRYKNKLLSWRHSLIYQVIFYVSLLMGVYCTLSISHVITRCEYDSNEGARGKWHGTLDSGSSRRLGFDSQC